MFLGLFFAGLVPAAPLVTAFACGMYYWIDKHCLCRAWSCHSWTQPDKYTALATPGYLAICVIGHLAQTLHLYKEWPFDNVCERNHKHPDGGKYVVGEPVLVAPHTLAHAKTRGVFDNRVYKWCNEGAEINLVYFDDDGVSKPRTFMEWTLFTAPRDGSSETTKLIVRTYAIASITISVLILVYFYGRRFLKLILHLFFSHAPVEATRKTEAPAAALDGKDKPPAGGNDKGTPFKRPPLSRQGSRIMDPTRRSIVNDSRVASFDNPSFNTPPRSFSSAPRSFNIAHRPAGGSAPPASTRVPHARSLSIDDGELPFSACKDMRAYIPNVKDPYFLFPFVAVESSSFDHAHLGRKLEPHESLATRSAFGLYDEVDVERNAFGMLGDEHESDKLPPEITGTFSVVKRYGFGVKSRKSVETALPAPGILSE